MPSIKISIPHNLSRQEAASRLKNMAEEIKKQYGNMVQNLKESWEGETGNFSFTVMGFDISGKVLVSDTDVTTDGQIPFAALPFKGRIESVLREKITQLLA